MKVAAVIAWISLALLYPALVYYSATHWPPRTASLVLLCTLAGIYSFQRVAAGAAKGSNNPMRKIPLLAVAVLGLGALLKHEGFARLVPILINGGLLVLFATSLRGPVSMVESFARRQDPDLTPEKVQYCRTVTIVWCGFFACNIALTLALALFAPLEWWTLYTGVLAYGAIGMLFTIEYAVRKARFRDYDVPPKLHDRLFVRLFPPRDDAYPMTTQSNTLVELGRTQIDGDSFRCRFLVPADLPLFRDHFPTRPVLPAFFISDWVLGQTRAIWTELGTWTGMPRFKLLLPIEPSTELSLELQRINDEVRFSVVAHTDEGDKPASTGMLRFAPTQPEP